MAKIMIIDDDVEFMDDITEILQGEGHQVSRQDTTQDAVEKIVRENPDLLLLDVMFPDNPVAGFDLAREVRHQKELKDLPVILLTGVNQEFPTDFSAQDVDPDWMPVQDFIEKPVKPSRLLEKIDQLLQ